MNTNSPMVLPNPFALQRGCYFQRVGPDVIRVWRHAHCAGCERTISRNVTTRTCSDDRQPLMAGLKPWGLETLPPEGHTIYTGSMPYCGTCVLNWRDPARRVQEPFHG